MNRNSMKTTDMKSKPIKLVFDQNYHSERNTLWSLTHHSQVKQERRKGLTPARDPMTNNRLYFLILYNTSGKPIDICQWVLPLVVPPPFITMQ